MCKTVGNDWRDDVYDDDTDEVPFFLVESSDDCSWVTQTRNVERAGGAMAVIIDSRRENITEVVLSDDGTGAGIRIPAMLINKKQGQALIDYYNSQETKDDEDLEWISMKADFVIQKATNNEVKVEMWYTSSDDNSLDFIRNIAEYLEPII